MSPPKLLIFGYGNPSRGDDGLGPLLLDKLAALRLPDTECLTDFQLQVEHALDLRGRELVLFVDAHLSCRPPFSFARLQPARDRSYTTHAMTPAAVMQVFQDIEGREPPPSFLLSIRGERFALGEDLSAAARANLEAGLAFIRPLCDRPSLSFWLEHAESAQETRRAV
jgi:hydrogenase maturation protease